MSQLKFNRLSISQKVLDKYFKKVDSAGQNPAYQYDGFPDTVFMQYREKGEIFFTMIGKEDYDKIKSEWSRTRRFISR